MQGVEKSHLNAVISALLKAFDDLNHSRVDEGMRKILAYGKGDTMGMDAGPEITICDELKRYDSGAVVITEEIGSRGYSWNDLSRSNDPVTFRTVYICDPTDRSNQLKAFLSKFPDEMKIGKIFESQENQVKWEAEFGSPASITGATSAITCVRLGMPIFTVIVNYVTHDMVISCAAGNIILKLPKEKLGDVDLNYVQRKGHTLYFPSLDAGTPKRFVTFLGDVGKEGYLQNFNDSGLMNQDDVKLFLHDSKPGGPSRILYLSTLQPKSFGFILSNGEKIGEWIHWLTFMRFAKNQHDQSQPAITVNEVSQGRPWTKDGVLMSTPPNYSVFREYSGRMFIDTNWLLRMPNPSRLRSTIIVSPYDNRWVLRASSQSGYRPIFFKDC